MISELVKKTLKERGRRALFLASIIEIVWLVGMVRIFVVFEAIELILYWGFWVLAIIQFLLMFTLALGWSFISFSTESLAEKAKKLKHGEV